MKIALVVPSLEPGGVEMVLFRLAGYLRGQGHEVTFVATAAAGRWWQRLADLQFPGVRLDAAESFNPVTHAWKVGKWLARQSFDAILLNHTRLAQAALGFLPESAVVLSVVHNDAESVYEVGCANAEAWNAAVGVGPKVCEGIKRRRPGRPIKEILSGVDLPPAEAWERRAQLRGPVKLLYVGRLAHAQKGVLLLPPIVKGCVERGVDASLTIAGDGGDLPRLRQAMVEAGVAERITWRGLLPPEEIYAVMLTHHLLLLPSYYEGFPIVPLEAQACGCVPVASRLRGITDRAIQDGRTGLLVEPGQAAGFVEGVVRLAADAAWWARLSRAGHDWIAKELSVESMGRAYLQLIADTQQGLYPLPRPRGKGFPLDWSLFTWRDHVPNFLRRLKPRQERN